MFTFGARALVPEHQKKKRCVQTLETLKPQVPRSARVQDLVLRHGQRARILAWVFWRVLWAERSLKEQQNDPGQKIVIFIIFFY